jgi:O-methyltransferase
MRSSAPSYPDLDSDFLPAHERCRAYTMTSTERMYALWGAAQHVSRRRIPGDAVECGVWRGGSSMLMALAFDAEGDHGRRIWLYDTFEGMNEPTEKDVTVHGLGAADHLEEIRSRPDDPILAAAGLEDVQANVATTGLPAERFRYVKGPVEETIPGTLPERIALLRLDTDWYESTRHELEHLLGQARARRRAHHRRLRALGRRPRGRRRVLRGPARRAAARPGGLHRADGRQAVKGGAGRAAPAALWRRRAGVRAGPQGPPRPLSARASSSRNPSRTDQSANDYPKDVHEHRLGRPARAGAVGPARLGRARSGAEGRAGAGGLPASG